MKFVVITIDCEFECVCKFFGMEGRKLKTTRVFIAMMTNECGYKNLLFFI